MRSGLMIAAGLLAVAAPMSVHAEPYVPAPKVTVKCDRRFMPAVSVKVDPNEVVRYEFRRLTPSPASLSYTRSSTSGSETFTTLSPGSWSLTVWYGVKGSMSTGFDVTACTATHRGPRPDVGVEKVVPTPKGN